MSTQLSADPDEVARFDRMAQDWWDPEGPMRALHRINPVRIGWIREEICRRLGRDPAAPFPFAGVRILDVGCGAGLVSEPMARLGATTTGLDPAGRNLDAARRHAEEGGLAIDYLPDDVASLGASGRRFDVVLALEVVEHVPDVPAFVAACAAILEPGGLLLMSTLNRTLRSFALAIVGAEYVLRWLPRGTHDWERFVTPDELGDAAEDAGLSGFRTCGLVYNPVARDWRLARDTAVNYFAAADKP